MKRGREGLKKPNRALGRVWRVRAGVTQQRVKEREMGIVSKTGDWAFKAFTAGLGLTTIYLAGTFSVNVYRGLAWHKAQSKMNNQDSSEQAT